MNAEIDSRPRGVRNNNPGNIDRTHPRQGWMGGIPDDKLTDTRFEQFEAPLFGLRAIAKTLITYSTKDGCRTVRDIIYRWAPRSDHNDTQSYALNVAHALGFSSELAMPNLHSEAALIVFLKAIVSQENGQDPYSHDLYVQAVQMALS